MSTPEQRQQWRELVDAATPGEWESHIDEDAGYVWVVGSMPMDVDFAWCGDNDADAAFIAAARAAVPALLADVLRVTAERDALAAELERVRAQLAAVPVDDIKKVTKAADMDGYSNWRVDEWLDELAQPQY